LITLGNERPAVLKLSAWARILHDKIISLPYLSIGYVI
jgi:hypothetical protein